LRKQLELLEPSLGKLKLMTALAGAYLSLNREEDAQPWVGRALDLGEELFSKDLRANPGKMAYMASGFEELTA
jgi:hypothetical protein